MNFIAQKFARVGDRQQQHRQLQPHVTRPQRRRSGDGLRGGRRHELLPGDRGDGPDRPVGLECARDASDLLPPRAEGAAQRRAAVRHRSAADQLRRSGPTCGSALDVGSDIALANAHGPRDHRRRPGRTASSSTARPPASRTYRAAVEPYTLEYAERETGVPAELIREMAHAYARADRARSAGRSASPSITTRSTTCWRSSTSRCSPATSGRYGSGLNPLRGQNNVQGGGDMGALPDRLPGFQHVENDASAREVRARVGRRRSRPSAAGTCPRCSRRWSAASCARSTSSARTRCSRRPTGIAPGTCSKGLDCLIVQDMFLTATAELAARGLPGRRRRGASPRAR